MRLFLCIVLFSFFCFIASERNLDVCDELETNCGLIPPSVPDSFIMKSLEVDQVNKKFTWVEKYFDPANLRAKLVTVSNGRETTYLYDYELEKIVTYVRLHPGAPLDKDPNSQMDCLTDDMKSSNYRLMMGFKEDQLFKKRSTMYDSYEALGFGGPHKYAEDNQTNNGMKMGLPSRGAACDVFVGCIYDQYMDKTLANVFYWTNDVLTASGSLTAPMRIISLGGYYESMENQMKQWIQQELITEIVFFDSSPMMIDSIFQVPPRMNCMTQNKPSSENVPRLSEAFSSRFESIITVENFKGEIKEITQDWYEEMWYDKPRQLARQDFYPNLIEDITLLQYFDGIQPISAVYDFKTGVAYFTDKTYGKCVATKIPEFVYFGTKSEDGKRMEMVSKDQVFDFNNENLSFKGKYDVRDIKCNAWSGEQDLKVKKGISKGYREVYFSTDGWHQETDKQDKYSIPVQETRIYHMQHDGQDAIGYMEINYYKFKMMQSPLSVFDISGCVEHHERRSFVLQFKNEYRNVLKNHQNAFIDRFTEKIVDYGKLSSLLRVQEIDIMFSEDTGSIHVFFTLLEKAKIEGIVDYPQQGVDLKTSVAQIKEVLANQQFIIDLLVDPKAEKTNLVPMEKTFKEVDYKTNTIVDVNYAAKLNATPSGSSYASGNSQGEAQVDAPTRYAPGSVAGLAVAMLIVGIVIGVAVMMFYLRKARFIGMESSVELVNQM